MSTLILVHGFWLHASSWDAVTPALRAAGHDVRAVILPGTESRGADQSSIGLSDHVAAVLEAVDSSDGRVVLVGSSFAGKLLQIVTDERPDDVELAVYVDALPKPMSAEPGDEPAGADLNFDWDEFTPDEQRDLTADVRRSIEGDAVPFPAKAVRDG
ncbi:alpha/beta fold hydrolase [Aeromicrobium sp.]|uniref:alpha/beta fold hydrolase n=1 Tax=Aeromicrobium sp. TaxID=1871063 RepID=UPI003D6B1D82